MRCLGRLLGLILAVFFVGMLPCSLWTYNTQRITLEGDTYKRVFKDKDFYDELTPRVLPALLKGLQEEDPAGTTVSFLEVINHLDAHDWKQIAPTLIPPGWVEHEVQTNLDSFLAWLDGNQDLVIVFQTEDLSRWLSGDPGKNALPQIAQALPACSPDQEQQFAQFVNETADVAFPYCRPEDSALLSQLNPLLDSARLAAADQLPTELNVVEEMRQALRERASDPAHQQAAEKAYSDEELNRFRSAVRLYKRLLPLTLMIPAVLLSLIVIVAIRSSKMFFRWMGWALIIGSLFTLLPLFFLPFMARDMSFSSELESGFAAGGALIAEVVGSRMVKLLIGAFTWPILEQSAVLIAIGFFFTVLSVLLRDPDAPQDDAGPTMVAVPAYQTPGGMIMSETPTRLDTTPSATPPTQRTPPGTRSDTP